MAQLNMIFALILGNFGFTILSVTTKINVDSRNVRTELNQIFHFSQNLNSQAIIKMLGLKFLLYVKSQLTDKQITIVISVPSFVFEQRLHYWGYNCAVLLHNCHILDGQLRLGTLRQGLT